MKKLKKLLSRQSILKTLMIFTASSLLFTLILVLPKNVQAYANGCTATASTTNVSPGGTLTVQATLTGGGWKSGDNSVHRVVDFTDPSSLGTLNPTGFSVRADGGDTNNSISTYTANTAGTTQIHVRMHEVNDGNKDYGKVDVSCDTATITIGAAPTPTPTPTPRSTNPPSTTTISGKLYNRTTGVGLAGKTVETCSGNAWWQTRWNNPSTDSSGNFSFQIPKGYWFCVVGPTVSGYSSILAVSHLSTAAEKDSYQWQVAGYACAGADKNNSTVCPAEEQKTRDKPGDGLYDLAYTPNASPTPSSSPTPTPVGSSSSSPTPTPVGSSSSSPTPTPVGSIVLQKIDISEDQSFPAGQTTTLLPPFTPDSSQFVYSTFRFANNTPGMKTLYIKYSAVDTSIAPIIVPKSIELVADTDSTGQTFPKITNITCSADSSNNVTFNIEGLNFGSGLLDSDNVSHVGQVKSAVNDAVTILPTRDGTWTENPTSTAPLVATLNNVPNTNTDFPITVIRFDGKSDPANPNQNPLTCNPGKQSLSVGTGYYCPAIPNHLISSADLKVYHVVSEADANNATTAAQVADQKVNIQTNGIIDWLGQAFNFLGGQNYFVLLDTPTTVLKYSDEFTAPNPSPGVNTGSTKVLTNLKLYDGDITGDKTPGVGDEFIDTFDQSEMFNQWGNYTGTAKTADFNLDLAVNSFDWACMIYGYRIPTPIQPFTLTQTDSTSTTPTTTPSPTPSESPSPSPSPS